MIKKGIPGIKINYNSDRKFDEQNKYFDVTFEIAYSTGKEKGSEFISNSEIREAIKKSLKSGLQRTSIEWGLNLLFNTKTRTATWQTYYPLGPPKEFKEFKKKGIANYLELLSLLEMKKRFPSLKKLVHRIPGDPRIKQLEKRKLDLREYSFEEAIEKLREKLRKDTRKAREKKIKTKIKRIARKTKRRIGINRLRH